jgi:hypothetical protein
LTAPTTNTTRNSSHLPALSAYKNPTRNDLKTHSPLLSWAQLELSDSKHQVYRPTRLINYLTASTAIPPRRRRIPRLSAPLSSFFSYLLLHSLLASLYTELTERARRRNIPDQPSYTMAFVEKTHVVSTLLDVTFILAFVDDAHAVSTLLDVAFILAFVDDAHAVSTLLNVALIFKFLRPAVFYTLLQPFKRALMGPRPPSGLVILGTPFGTPTTFLTAFTTFTYKTRHLQFVQSPAFAFSSPASSIKHPVDFSTAVASPLTTGDQSPWTSNTPSSVPL